MSTTIPLCTCVRVPFRLPTLVGGLLLQENVEWKVNQSHKQSRSVKQEPWEPKQTSQQAPVMYCVSSRQLPYALPSFYFNAARKNVHSIQYFAFFQSIFVTSHEGISVTSGMLNKRNVEILVAHRNKIYIITILGSLIVPVSLNDTLSKIHTLSCLPQIADCQAGRLHVCRSAKQFVILVDHLTTWWPA
jgi:hypothetical protein